MHAGSPRVWHEPTVPRPSGGCGSPGWAAWNACGSGGTGVGVCGAVLPGAAGCYPWELQGSGCRYMESGVAGPEGVLAVECSGVSVGWREGRMRAARRGVAGWPVR